MCVEGQALATQTLSKNFTGFGVFGVKGGVFSLENITTTGQNEFGTSCEADVVVTVPENVLEQLKAHPEVNSNPFRGHTQYVVRITAEGKLYVKASTPEMVQDLIISEQAAAAKAAISEMKANPQQR